MSTFNSGAKVTSTLDGGFGIIGAGLSDPLNTEMEMAVAKVDRNGNLLWHILYPTNETEFTVNLKETQDGGFIATSEVASHLGALFDPALVKIGPSGNIEWQMVYQYAENVSPYSVNLTLDGGYIVTGGIFNAAFEEKIFVLKVSANGTKEWDKSIGIAKTEFGTEVLTHADGSYTIVGWQQDASSSRDPKIVKLDPTGNVLWEQIYTSAVDQTTYSAAFHPDGSYILAGHDVNSPYDIWLKKLDPAGMEEWSNTISLPDIQLNPDIAIIPDGGYAIAATTITGGPEIGNAIKTDSLGNLIWLRELGTNLNGVSLTDDDGFLFVGGKGISASLFDMSLNMVKLDKDGNKTNSFLSGNVVFDQNQSCSLDSGEPGMDNWLVEVKGKKLYYSLTDSNGDYLINVDSGSYELKVIPSSLAWQPCQQIHTVYADTNLTVVTDHFMRPIDSCAHMTVDISTPFLRRCFSTNYIINYCNGGTIPALNAYVDIAFDPFLTVNSSSIPWSAQTGNIYTFPVGDVNINKCGKFSVNVTVDCDSTVLGQTHCTEATVFPLNCIDQQSSWEGSITSLSVQCGQDSVSFTIKNTGFGDMGTQLNYIVAEDNIIMKTGPFQLTSGAQDSVKVPTNGSTYRLFAEQSPGYFPPAYAPTIAIEGCGVDSTGSFSTGFITMFSENDILDDTSLDCQENIGSFDPNDKRAEPKGYGSEHFIDIGEDLEYHIRFQNVGTDTAFTVVIRDTLSDYLDVSSLKEGVSSHSYSLNIINGNILTFVFNNILLVDSTTNEPASNGFVKFRISQTPNLPLGTVIHNQAGIYFDFNEPVITNQTFHKIGKDFIPIEIIQDTTELSVHELPDFSIDVTPNPFIETTEFVLTRAPSGNKTFHLHDATGRLLRQEQFDQNNFIFSRNGLPQGIYFYTIKTADFPLGTGKILIHSR